VNRLTGMIEMETHPKLKKDLESRVDRIVSEATVNYQKSAMATFQAEKLRNLRREQEAEIAGLAAKLSPIELAEVNQVLGGEPYTVVPSDFATAELSDEKPRSKSVEKPKEVIKVEATVPEVTDSRAAAASSEISEIADVIRVVEAPGTGKTERGRNDA